MSWATGASQACECGNLVVSDMFGLGSKHWSFFEFSTFDPWPLCSPGPVLGYPTMVAAHVCDENYTGKSTDEKIFALWAQFTVLTQLLIQQTLSNIIISLLRLVNSSPTCSLFSASLALHHCLSGGKPKGTSSPENNRCSESMTDILSCVFFTVCMIWHDWTCQDAVLWPAAAGGKVVLLCTPICVWTWCWTSQT